MKVKIPSLVHSTFLYTAANLLNAIVPILLLPVLTTYLTKEDYGLVSLFQVMIMITLPFTGLNVQGAIEREFFHRRFAFQTYTSSGMYLVFFSSLIILSLFILLGPYISSWIEFPHAYLWVIPCYCLFHNLSEILLSIWRVEKRPVSYGFFRIARTLFEIGISILFVTELMKGWLGRVEGMVIAALIASSVAIFILKSKGFVKTRFDVVSARDILRFGLPLIPHTLGGIIMIYSDRIFITKMVGLAETGSYTVGYQVAMGIYLLQSSFNLAWVPWFYEKLEMNSDLYKRKIVRFTYFYSIALLTCAFGLTFVSPILFKLFISENYFDSIQFIFWIALGFAFDGMYKMVVNYIFFVRKTYWVSIITFLTAGLNLLLNFYFIRLFGAVGAAKATAVCMFIEFIAVWIVSNRLFPMPWFNVFSRQKIEH